MRFHAVFLALLACGQTSELGLPDPPPSEETAPPPRPAEASPSDAGLRESSAPPPTPAPTPRIVIGGLEDAESFDVDEISVYVSASGGITSCERSGECPSGGRQAVAVGYAETHDVVAWGPNVFFAGRRFANDSPCVARCARGGGYGPNDDEFLEFAPATIDRLVRGPYDVVWTRADGVAHACPSGDCTLSTVFEVQAARRPNALAVSAVALYSADDAHVYASAFSGSSALTTFADVTKPVVALGEHQGTVAWATTDEIWSKSELTNGAPKRIATDAAGIADVALDATHVYWVNATTGNVERCARDGCIGAPEVVASNQHHPKRLRLWDSEVFWMDDDAIRARTK